MITDQDHASEERDEITIDTTKAKEPNRANRRQYAKVAAKIAKNKARNAKAKEKCLTKTEMIELARARQGLPPVCPEN